ncbi:hypothetical protein BY996DRAFT_7010656 [Phakopsora pachyrhizi]|nr:hypothetical protein BY996DRAFT_7010656 [Phakopsora pachyrhizi]
MGRNKCFRKARKMLQKLFFKSSGGLLILNLIFPIYFIFQSLTFTSNSATNSSFSIFLLIISQAIFNFK